MKNYWFYIGLILFVVGSYLLYDGIDTLITQSKKSDYISRVGWSFTRSGREKMEQKKTTATVEIIGGSLALLIGLGFITKGKRKRTNITSSELMKTKKCPNCAEEVKIEAKICRFCKYTFVE